MNSIVSMVEKASKGRKESSRSRRRRKSKKGVGKGTGTIKGQRAMQKSKVYTIQYNKKKKK